MTPDNIIGDSRTPLYSLMLSSIVNVILDLTFMLALGMEVFGVALATIISQAISAVTCLLYAYHKVPYFVLTAVHPHSSLGLLGYLDYDRRNMDHDGSCMRGKVLSGQVAGKIYCCPKTSRECNVLKYIARDKTNSGCHVTVGRCYSRGNVTYLSSAGVT